MKQRTLTGVVLALMAAVLLGCFHLPYFPQLTAIVIGCGAVWEILGVNGIENKGSRISGCVLAVLLPLLSLTENRYWVAVMLVCGLVLFTYLMANIGKLSPNTCIITGEILFALSLYRCLASYGRIPYGAFYLCLTGLICALTDIFAYLVGSRFGRHKLAPRVSPGKSIEGALGGLFVTVIVLFLLFSRFFTDSLGFVLYLIAVSVLGQLGDLSMSAVKRVAGVKDFGKIFPGHGGILDRLDSLMYPLAFTWLLFCFKIWIFT